MPDAKRADTSVVITMSLPKTLLDSLPVQQRGRSKYLQALIRQDLAKRSRMPQDARSAPAQYPSTPDGVRTLEDRLNAIQQLERALSEITVQLSTHIADLAAFTRRTASFASGQPISGGTRSTSNAAGIAQNVDPFSALPDPDRPGRVRLKTNQDGSAQFEVVQPDGPPALPAPQPMTRPSLPKTRPGDL